MAYLALYRKYRPSKFDDVVGQEKIISVINNGIINDKVSHAYLFSGPRGTGKTTTAKIIAKMVNCENLIDGKPCNECNSCINFSNSNDIIEIDAASNNGVDEIREIRDRVNLVPSNCKYKVYIIDEVHMLTTQAFNALLKTLEEPPKHVIFILATTEIYKIPLTITSRCQKFQFTKIDDVDIVKRLSVISKMENILINEDALYEIARLSDGGLRDAINLLDQLTAYKSDLICLEDVYKISGSVNYIDLYTLFVNIKNLNYKDIIKFIEEIDKNGKNITKFVEEIIIFLKDVLIYKSTNILTKIKEKNEKIKIISEMLSEDDLFFYINEFNDLLNRIKIANFPSILLIVELLKLANKDLINMNDDSYEKKSNVSNEVNSKDKSELDDKLTIKNNNDVVNNINNKLIDIRINNALAFAEKSILLNIKSLWSSLSNYLLDEKYSALAGLLVDVNPVVASKDYLILESKFESTVDRLNFLVLDIENFLNEVFNIKYKVVSISFERWKFIRNKYVNDKKNGIIYKFINENIEKNDKKSNKIDSSVEKLVELFGEDVIEYR